jgi:uncharacterized protein YbjT (DUF2867 family)
MTRVLVAGASGHLGGHILSVCRERGYWTRALARTDQKALALRQCADDVFVGQATQGETLSGLCNEIEAVVSCLGASVAATHLPDKRSYHDVDYAANRNLLHIAKAAGVRKFVYVSVFATPGYAQTAYVRAHEDFANELKASGLEYAILRPTGFFSAYAEFVRLAMKGPLPLVGGGGKAKTNPIHEADLAKICVDAIDAPNTELAVGGTDIFTRREIAELAFQALDKKPRTPPMPAFVFGLARTFISPFDKRLRDLIEFIGAVSVSDAVAPAVGTYHLADYFREEAAKIRASRMR